MYASIAGPGWLRLPSVIRAIHEPGRVRGSFRVRRGRGLAGVLARLCGFPPDADAQDVELQIVRQGDRLLWQRRFGGRVRSDGRRSKGVAVHSWQEARDGRLCEGFGCFLCAFELCVVDGDALEIVQRAAWLRIGSLELALPRGLAPRVGARVERRGERAHVAVQIHAPVVGCVVAYEGPVEPCGSAS